MRVHISVWTDIKRKGLKTKISYLKYLLFLPPAEAIFEIP